MRSVYRSSAGASLTAATVAAGGQANIPAYTVPPFTYASVQAVQAANQTYYMRVMGGYAAAATAIKLYIGTSSGNICVAVYEDAGATPGARLATSGSVASPGTNVQTVALGGPVAIYPGRWISIAADNTTVTFGRAGGPSLLNNGMGAGFSYYEASAFPSPATPAPTANSFYAGFLLMSA
jgi:hypothetical protein